MFRSSLSSARFLALLIFVALVTPSTVFADVGPPVHTQISEIEAGTYWVTWRVPKVLPPKAAPIPKLPEACRPTTDATVTNQPAAWLFGAEWRCESSLAGQVVGMDYPYPDLTLTTVIRVDLLSGDRFACVLSQGEESWRLPDGTAAPDLLKEIQSAVIAGAVHALLSPLHVAFLLVIGLFGAYRRTIRLLSAFAVGQIVGALVSVVDTGVGAPVAELAVAIAIVVIARQALEPEDHRKGLSLPAAMAGVVHGLGLAAILTGDLGNELSRLLELLLAILGMDAVHIVIGFGVTALLILFPDGKTDAVAGKVLPYALGAMGVAFAVNAALQPWIGGTESATASLVMPPEIAVGQSTSVAGSRR